MKSFKDTKYGNLMGKTYKGDIVVQSLPIESLEGAPKAVKGNFSCSFCENLQTLKYAPKTIDGKFDCSFCKNLKTLHGAPEIVDGEFNCSLCKKLPSLKYAPKFVKGDFSCTENEKLETLEGAPETVEGDFYCNFCKNLETLKGAPKKCKTFNCVGCKKLKNLDPLLRCDIEKVAADKHLLDEYNKKKKIIDKHGYDKAMEVFEMLDDLI